MSQEIKAGQRQLSADLQQMPSCKFCGIAVAWCSCTTRSDAPLICITTPTDLLLPGKPKLPRPATLLSESPEADTFTVTREDLERWAELENAE